MRGGARPGAGRKPKPDAEKKKIRSMKFTDAEWAYFNSIAKQRGLSVAALMKCAIQELEHSTVRRISSNYDESQLKYVHDLSETGRDVLIDKVFSELGFFELQSTVDRRNVDPKKIEETKQLFSSVKESRQYLLTAVDLLIKKGYFEDDAKKLVENFNYVIKTIKAIKPRDGKLTGRRYSGYSELDATSLTNPLILYRLVRAALENSSIRRIAVIKDIPMSISMFEDPNIDNLDFKLHTIGRPLVVFDNREKTLIYFWYIPESCYKCEDFL